ncbi:MAG: ATP-binding protein [Bryobacteraceae bacterium]
MVKDTVRFPRPKHVRTRLTLWYVFVLAGVLALSWAVTASFLFLQMRGQLDNYAVQDIETVEGLLNFDASGHLNLREDYHNHPESKEVLERLVEVRSSNGTVLYRNERLGDQPLGGNLIPGEGEGGYSIRAARLVDGTTVRMASRRHTLDGRPIVIRLGYSEQPIWARFEELAVATLLAVPIVLALAGLGGYLLAKRALAPLEQMTSRAEEITSERLHERLPTGEVDDELGHLARVFNNLLARLEQSFEQLRRFTADASHELRTPLTAIRSVGEVALQKDGSREEYRDTIGSMLEEVNRLTTLVESLLTISRADAGRIQLHPTIFPAMDLAREAAGLFEVLVEEKGQRIVVEGDEGVDVRGDRVFLRQALVNIIHNAVKHSPVGGAISVGVHSEAAGNVLIEVADDGPGIAPEHSQRIFDRFYRADESRSREEGGAGLGLSIAQWAVRVHGGDIQLRAAQGEGCTFQICLPIVTNPR